MKTLILDKDNIHEGNIVLINANNPLLRDGKSDLIPADKNFPYILLNRDAANILRFILKKINAGRSIVPVSGYRSEEEQAAIYNDSMKENGTDFTQKYVALPNRSEHQTGLAIDLGLYSDNIDFIRPDFPYDGICEVFRKTAPDYGFIERYAKDKEEITGIAHEPWHFRYVGFPHSKIMEQKNISLEEYTEHIKDYTEHNRLVYEDRRKGRIEIYYVPASDRQTEIAIPEHSEYQISGNNTDGFIVTVLRKIQ